VDTAGKSYDFGDETRGKVTMLYFGYTHCPDECPTSMADLAQALRRVPAEVAKQVAVVFVTTDPWRDKKPVLRKWLDRFSPTFIGLTGTPTQIAGAEVRMGMPISRRVPGKKKTSAGRYSVDHFAAVMAFGRDNRLATLYPAGVTPGDIATDMSVLVKG
jgi:protein SCO1/2